MKLRTRIKLAWLEMMFAAAFLVGAVAVKLAMPNAPTTPMGVILDILFALFLAGPFCVGSWKRLKETRDQLAEFGPDGAPSVDLWTAPGAPGIIGVMVVAAAVFMAFVPALLHG